MIHRLLIPGIIAGALHGGLLLIPNTPAPPPAQAAKPFEVISLGVLPKVPVIPDDDPDAPRAKGEAGRPDSPAVPMLPQTPVAAISGEWTSPFTPDLPPINVDPNALNPGLGDILKNGFEPGDGGRGVISSLELDRQPRTVFQVAPDYPAAAKHDGLSGTVTVVFRVDENGDVHDARVAGSSDTVFNDAAIRAVSRWRFEPGQLHGRRVAFRMSVPISFNLSEEE